MVVENPVEVSTTIISFLDEIKNDQKMMKIMINHNFISR